MRNVTYGGAVSLDGFLADANGGDRLAPFRQGRAEGNGGVLERRRHHPDRAQDIRRRHGNVRKRRGAEGGKERTAVSRKPAIRTYVFSRTLKAIDKPGVELVKGDAAAFVRDLKQRPGKNICLMGGGELAQSLIAEGLVDVVGLNIHPILLGSGAPVFRDPGHRVKLSLNECRPIDGGCVVVKYALARK